MLIVYQADLSDKLTDVYSRNIETARDIDLFYESLVSMLNISYARTIPTSKYNAHKNTYWSPSVKHAHGHARENRNVWVTNGRPRGMHHASYSEYKQAKRQFRNTPTSAVDAYCEYIYRDTDTAAECDIRLFWSLLKK
jgi:hypothetical protein